MTPPDDGKCWHGVDIKETCFECRREDEHDYVFGVGPTI